MLQLLPVSSEILFEFRYTECADLVDLHAKWNILPAMDRYLDLVLFPE